MHSLRKHRDQKAPSSSTCHFGSISGIQASSLTHMDFQGRLRTLRPHRCGVRYLREASWSPLIMKALFTLITTLLKGNQAYAFYPEEEEYVDTSCDWQSSSCVQGLDSQGLHSLFLILETRTIKHSHYLPLPWDLSEMASLTLVHQRLPLTLFGHTATLKSKSKGGLYGIIGPQKQSVYDNG